MNQCSILSENLTLGLIFVAFLWLFWNVSNIIKATTDASNRCPKTVQKKFKKLLTLNLRFGIVALHTVTYRNKMRTKTLLLSAVALAAGVVASQAQSNVYSANIVGYVTVTNPAGGYVMLANPLDNGTNDLASLLTGAPTGSQVFVFQGGTLQPSTKSKGVWTPNFIVPPGTGFFFSGPVAGTNTFVGSIAGFSNGIPLTAGVTLLAGSPIPFSGTLADQGTNTLNLNVLPTGSTIYTYVNGGLQPSTKSKGIWTPNVTISPGQGFYVNSPNDTNVIQILNLQ
jgi:hypothetical protein